MKLSLYARFLYPTVFLILIGLATPIVVSDLQNRKVLRDALQIQLEVLTGMTRDLTESWLQDRKLDLETWSRQKDVQNALDQSFFGSAARKDLNIFFAMLKTTYGYYEDINLAGPDGEIIASSQPDIVGKVKVGDRTYHQEALKGKSYASKVLASRVTGNLILVLSMPVRQGERVSGVLFSVLDIKTAFSDRFFNPIKIGEAGYAYLVNDEGWVISHPDAANIMKMNLNQLDFGKEILARGAGEIGYTYENVTKIAVFDRIESLGWTLVTTAGEAEMLAPMRSVLRDNIIIAGVVVFVVIFSTFLIVRSLMGRMGGIAAELSRGNEMIFDASREISAASLKLSEGASEQAAAIEMTAASMEEMSAMARQNAENAGQAKKRSARARQVLDAVHRHMEELNEAFDKINRSSSETRQIIKTIDEIAFQTNLLALNAAVEAARAGEAGAGFAVVAGEVRTLAMRAGDAAGNTATLINDTIEALKNGNRITRATQAVLDENKTITLETADLIEEIAAASQEQAEGVDQASGVVSEMNTVTQSTAANAEETSSSAEEMHRFAVEMKRMVNDLVVLIRGAKADGAAKARIVGGGGNGDDGIGHDDLKRLTPPRHDAQMKRARKSPPTDDLLDF